MDYEKLSVKDLLRLRSGSPPDTPAYQKAKHEINRRLKLWALAAAIVGKIHAGKTWFRDTDARPQHVAHAGELTGKRSPAFVWRTEKLPFDMQNSKELCTSTIAVDVQSICEYREVPGSTGKYREVAGYGGTTSTNQSLKLSRR